MQHRGSKRLRQQRQDEDDWPVVTIWHDPQISSEAAYAAALQAGHIPANAAVLVVPRRCRNPEEFEAVVRADEERRRNEQQRSPAGIGPAGQS